MNIQKLGIFPIFHQKLITDFVAIVLKFLAWLLLLLVNNIVFKFIDDELDLNTA